MENLKLTFWVIVCILLQALVFNDLHLFGGVCFVLLLPLLRLPITINGPLQILIGFVCGLIMDIFCNTHGLYAFSLSTMMFIKPSVLKMFVDIEAVGNGEISSYRVGSKPYMLFNMMMTFLFCIILFGVESLFLMNLPYLIGKILISLLLTTIFNYFLEMVCD